MGTPYSIKNMLYAWWFPWTSATIFCYAAFIYFERRYDELATKVLLGTSDEKEASSLVRKYREAHGFEGVSTSSGAGSFDTLRKIEAAHKKIKDSVIAELACQSLLAKAANKNYISTYSGDEEEEAVLYEHEDPVQSTDGTSVPTVTYARYSSPAQPTHGNTHPKEEPTTPRSPHISFACSTLKGRRRRTVANLVTTALSQGSSITINPPPNTVSSSIPSPTIFPRPPFPFGSPRPSIATLSAESPGPFPWTKTDFSKKLNRSSISSEPKLDFKDVGPNTKWTSLPQMPTIAEESGTGVGLGISGVLDGDVGKQKKSVKRKRWQARKGARKGAAGIP